MSEPTDNRSENYRDARSAFDHLPMEERAMFLIEAAITTVSRGVEHAGRALADIFDDLFHAAPQNGSADTAASEDAADAPAKEAPSKTTTTKKATTKKTPTKKTTKSASDDPSA